MEYKDIKTADELESWYAEKEDILEGHVRDYAVPFGNVYHLDSPGYVSEERWCDTLPSDRERSTFMALQNGVSTKEIQVRFPPWTFRCKGCKSEAGRPRE